MIRTESGYKKVSDIIVGEKILTNEGYRALVNMVTGTEDEIVAVSTGAGRTLLITKEHPVSTSRGAIRAIDLRISDRLQMEDGAFKDIHYLEVIPYHDKVYSPELETSALISADGIMIGDYLTSAKEEPDKAETCEPLDPQLEQELRKWMTLKKEQLQQEANP